MLLVLVAVCAWWWGSARAVPSSAAEVVARSGAAGATVVVGPGDTLWAIAGEHVPPGGDVLGYAATIAERNGVRASALQPGSVLVLP